MTTFSERRKFWESLGAEINAVMNAHRRAHAEYMKIMNGLVPWDIDKILNLRREMDSLSNILRNGTTL